VVDALHQPVRRVIALDGAGSDRRERRAAGGLGDRVRGGCGLGALVPARSVQR
jgi:hypothetical protein